MVDWCLSHGLKIAVKDALKGTVFDVIDEMLVRLYIFVKLIRSCVTRLMVHKLNVMKHVNKFGLYMEHLQKISTDPDYNTQMRAKVIGSNWFK